jgi:thiazolylpeptide-type bacteriocin precursor
MNNTHAMDFDAVSDQTRSELTLSDFEITDLLTEDALGIPELGASYCGSSCSACCSCCCP